MLGQLHTIAQQDTNALAEDASQAAGIQMAGIIQAPTVRYGLVTLPTATAALILTMCWNTTARVIRLHPIRGSAVLVMSVQVGRVSKGVKRPMVETRQELKEAPEKEDAVTKITA
jgi:hypothetical protein